MNALCSESPASCCTCSMYLCRATAVHMTMGHYCICTPHLQRRFSNFYLPSGACEQFLSGHDLKVCFNVKLLSVRTTDCHVGMPPAMAIGSQEPMLTPQCHRTSSSHSGGLRCAPHRPPRSPPSSAGRTLCGPVSSHTSPARRPPRRAAPRAALRAAAALRPPRLRPRHAVRAPAPAGTTRGAAPPPRYRVRLRAASCWAAPQPVISQCCAAHVPRGAPALWLSHAQISRSRPRAFCMLRR